MSGRGERLVMRRERGDWREGRGCQIRLEHSGESGATEKWLWIGTAPNTPHRAFITPHAIHPREAAAKRGDQISPGPTHPVPSSKILRMRVHHSHVLSTCLNHSSPRLTWAALVCGKKESGPREKRVTVRRVGGRGKWLRGGKVEILVVPILSTLNHVILNPPSFFHLLPPCHSSPSPTNFLFIYFF